MEQEHIADNAMHIFNGTLTLVPKQVQLQQAKRMLKHIRDLVEKLEMEINKWPRSSSGF